MAAEKQTSVGKKTKAGSKVKTQVEAKNTATSATGASPEKQNIGKSVAEKTMAVDAHGNKTKPKSVAKIKSSVKSGTAKTLAGKRVSASTRKGGKVKKASKTKTSATRKVSAKTDFGQTPIKPYKTRKKEAYMNDAQKQHFRNILQSWKLDLLQEVDRTVTHMKEQASNFPDPADRASQEEEFSLELRTRDRERRLIRKIESTIELIDQDDYGYCESCGIEIGVRRLEARPTATLCIDCKTLDEIKEKRLHG